MYLSGAELRQLDLLKKKNPQQRFLLMAQLIEAQIEMMKAGIKYKNPSVGDKGLEECLRIRIRQIYSWKH